MYLINYHTVPHLHMSTSHIESTVQGVPCTIHHNLGDLFTCGNFHNYAEVLSNQMLISCKLVAFIVLLLSAID